MKTALRVLFFCSFAAFVVPSDVALTSASPGLTGNFLQEGFGGNFPCSGGCGSSVVSPPMNFPSFPSGGSSYPSISPSVFPSISPSVFPSGGSSFPSGFPSTWSGFPSGGSSCPTCGIDQTITNPFPSIGPSPCFGSNPPCSSGGSMCPYSQPYPLQPQGCGLGSSYLG